MIQANTSVRDFSLLVICQLILTCLRIFKSASGWWRSLFLTNWKPVQRSHFIFFNVQLKFRLSPHLWCIENFEIVEIFLPFVINTLIISLIKVWLRVIMMSSVRKVQPIFISHIVFDDNVFTIYYSRSVLRVLRGRHHILCRTSLRINLDTLVLSLKMIRRGYRVVLLLLVINPWLMLT